MTVTTIEWTNRTWNFIAGCSIVSAGCTNCYAMKQAERIALMQPSLAHYQGLTKSSKTGPVWTGKIGIAEHKLMEPLTVKKPKMWFVNSMSDLFHADVPDAVIDRAFAVMALCPQHTFQILTKRPERMRDYMSAHMRQGEISIARRVNLMRGTGTGDPDGAMTWPLPNVWLGVSVEDQRSADARIPVLLSTPAAVRWISAEPLLGPVDLRFLQPGDPPVEIDALNGTHGVIRPHGGVSQKLNWVVVGGESGPGARPMHPDWARSLRDQCADTGVPFFFKQWGEYVEAEQMPNAFSASEEPLCVHGGDFTKLGKARAGQLLDGVEHNAFPEVVR